MTDTKFIKIGSSILNIEHIVEIEDLKPEGRAVIRLSNGIVLNTFDRTMEELVHFIQNNCFSLSESNMRATVFDNPDIKLWGSKVPT